MGFLSKFTVADWDSTCAYETVRIAKIRDSAFAIPCYVVIAISSVLAAIYFVWSHGYIDNVDFESPSCVFDLNLKNPHGDNGWVELPKDPDDPCYHCRNGFDDPKCQCTVFDKSDIVYPESKDHSIFVAFSMVAIQQERVPVEEYFNEGYTEFAPSLEWKNTSVTEHKTISPGEFQVKIVPSLTSCRRETLNTRDMSGFLFKPQLQCTKDTQNQEMCTERPANEWGEGAGEELLGGLSQTFNFSKLIQFATEGDERENTESVAEVLQRCGERGCAMRLYMSLNPSRKIFGQGLLSLSANKNGYTTGNNVLDPDSFYYMPYLEEKEIPYTVKRTFYNYDPAPPSAQKVETAPPTRTIWVMRGMLIEIQVSGGCFQWSIMNMCAFFGLLLAGGVIITILFELIGVMFPGRSRLYRNAMFMTTRDMSDLRNEMQELVREKRVRNKLRNGQKRSIAVSLQGYNEDEGDVEMLSLKR